jgi:hypothetical protein
MTNGSQEVGYNRISELSDFVKEEDKSKERYLIGNCDRHIADLVTDKIYERKCYDFFNGIRDNSEFQHLVDNYGVSHPQDIPFVPLMGVMIKALTNVQLQNHLDYQVTCQNSDALLIKQNERRFFMLEEISLEVMNTFNKHLQMVQEYQKLMSRDPKKAESIKEELERESKKKMFWIEDLKRKISQKYGSNWKTDYEVAAQDYIQYYIDRYNLKQKFNMAFQDLCVTGQAYIRTYIKELGKDPVVELCNPEETFFDYNEEKMWLQDCRRVVHRRWMTSGDILTEYGHYLTEEDRTRLEMMFVDYYNNYGRWRNEQVFINQIDSENRSNQEHLYFTGTARWRRALIPVFHVEWISPNEVEADNDVLDLVHTKGRDNINSKKRRRKDRYECYKIDIGRGLYFGYGKCAYVNREHDNPYECKLSYNGLLYRGRNSKPYSLVWATRDIQNMYDITYFQLNNLFSMARPGGVIIPLEHIPKQFGDKVHERIIKNAAYKKAGMDQIVSLSQEGMEGQYAFNNFGSYPSNLDGGLLQAYMNYLEILREQAMNIVGLNRQLLGQIEEQDGKSTTTMAIKQGEVITKDLYYLNGMLIKQTLTNVVNLSRLTVMDNWVGSVTVGDTHKIFSIDAERYSLADYGVFISDDLEDTEKLKRADELLLRALDNNLVDLQTAFNTLMSRSISRRKQVIDQGVAAIEQSAMTQLANMQQENEQLQKQIEELQATIQKLGGKEALIQEEKLKLEREKLNLEKETKLKELELKNKQINDNRAIKEEALNVEKLQIKDNNPNNNSINFNMI